MVAIGLSVAAAALVAEIGSALSKTDAYDDAVETVYEDVSHNNDTWWETLAPGKREYQIENELQVRSVMNTYINLLLEQNPRISEWKGGETSDAYTVQWNIAYYVAEAGHVPKEATWRILRQLYYATLGRRVASYGYLYPLQYKNRPADARPADTLPGGALQPAQKGDENEPGFFENLSSVLSNATTLIIVCGIAFVAIWLFIQYRSAERR